MAKSDKVEHFTPSVLDERLGNLKQMFPEFFTDGKLDVPKLRELLGEGVEEETERYRFTWAGKRDAIQLLQTPTRATLVPCREESVDFDTTENIFIEGDNLEALKLLYKPYFGQVNAIYVDPPYNTGDDFVYRDNYTDPLHSYLQLTGQRDEEGKPLTTNVETSGRYHSDWMSMMYPRLFLARQLLSDDGLIFVSIDDNEVHNLRLMMNEIFGEENCIQLLVWQRHSGAGNHAKYCATDHEYILAYAKHLQAIDKLRRPLKKEEEAAYTETDDNYPTLGPYKTRDFESQEQYGGYTGHQYKIKCPDGSTILSKWRWKEQRFLQAKKENRIAFTQDEDGIWQVAYKLYRDESRRVLRSLLTDVEKNSQGRTQIRELFKEYHIFDYPKPVGLVKHLLQFSSPNAVVLDFFAGSCTTAQAVLELNREDDGNRRFIMIQLPEPTPEKSAAKRVGYETIADIGKERIRRVLDVRQDGDDQFEPRDIGVKIFKLTESNYRSWNGIPEDAHEAYVEQISLFLDDPLVEGWVPENVIYEVALKEGYRLDSPIEQVKGLQRNVIFRVVSANQKQAFYICLDEELFQDDIDTLGLTHDNLLVCRDQAMDDTQAANLALQCRLKTI